MNASPDSSVFRLTPPFQPFWRWWAFWALFPLLFLLPYPWLLLYGGWLFNLMWIPLMFWSGLRPMRVWLQGPRPVWLFFVLALVVPLLLFAVVGAGVWGVVGL
jgi:hypothetical protein